MIKIFNSVNAESGRECISFSHFLPFSLQNFLSAYPFNVMSRCDLGL